MVTVIEKQNTTGVAYEIGVVVGGRVRINYPGNEDRSRDWKHREHHNI